MDFAELLSVATTSNNVAIGRSSNAYDSTASSQYSPSANPAVAMATAAAAASSSTAYDGTGAMCYTLVIVLLFGLGIMLLIATQVSYHHQETAIGKYMKEIELVRENIVRAGNASGVPRPLPRVTTASSLLDRAFLA